MSTTTSQLLSLHCITNCYKIHRYLKKKLGKTKNPREDANENTKRPLRPRLLGPRASVAAFAVLVAVCTVCAAFAAACAAAVCALVAAAFAVAAACVPVGTLLLQLFVLLLLILLVLFSCVAAVWCSLLFVQLAAVC